MPPPVYDMLCSSCSHENEKEMPSSETENNHDCPECGKSEYRRVWRKMPGTTKASYIDSKNTKRASDVDKLRKVAQLESMIGDRPPSERPEIRKEINILKKV